MNFFVMSGGGGGETITSQMLELGGRLHQVCVQGMVGSAGSCSV